MTLLYPSLHRLSSAAHRKYRASLARGSALFFRTMRWQEPDTDFRRGVLGWHMAKDKHRILQGDSAGAKAGLCPDKGLASLAPLAYDALPLRREGRKDPKTSGATRCIIHHP